MTEQITDHSDTLQRQLEGSLGIAHNTLNQVSGLPLDFQLKNAWAVIAFVGKKAHYWRRTKNSALAGGKAFQKYISLCGTIAWVGDNPVFHPGTIEKCSKCRAKYQRGVR